MELQVDYFILEANERGPCNFTAMFDCLKLLYLKYKGYNSNRFWWHHRRSDNYLDNASFPLLFFHDTQGLETIRFVGNVELLYAARYLDVLINDEKINNTLKKLDINVRCMDILCLQFITKKLKRIENLTIRVSDAVKVDESSIIKRRGGGKHH